MFATHGDSMQYLAWNGGYVMGDLAKSNADFMVLEGVVSCTSQPDSKGATKLKYIIHHHRKLHSLLPHQ